jgi:hypothetical protein
LDRAGGDCTRSRNRAGDCARTGGDRGRCPLPVAERLPLRSLGRFRLFGGLLLLFSRRRKKSLQHQLLVGDYQYYRQNYRDQNSARIQLTNPYSNF